MTGRAGGQMSLLALVAIAVVVVAVASLLVARGRAEGAARAGATEASEAAEEVREASAVVEGALRDAVDESVYELGRHGGYTAEALPGPVVGGRPVYLVKGRLSSFPSIKVMEALLAQDSTRRLAAKLEAARASLKGGVAFGAPRVSVSLQEEGVKATASVAFGAPGEGASARSIEDVTVTLGLRLRTLWSRAKAYLEAEERERHVERNLLMGITNDERVPSPPGGLGETMGCQKRKVVATLRTLATPFSENARLAVAKELERVRAAGRGEPDVEWSMRLSTGRVDLSLRANPGSDRESADTVEHVPFPFPFIDRRDGAEPVCLSRYNVTYTALFPVDVTLRDLRPVARGVRGEGRPLELAFVVEPYLVGIDPFARGPAEHPASVDDLCASGGCSLELTVTGPGGVPVDGVAWVDACALPFEGGRLVRAAAPCGERALVVESLRPAGLGRSVQRVTVQGAVSRSVVLGGRGRLGGRVHAAERVWCTDSRIARDMGDAPLGFVDGVPPRQVSLHLVPLDSALGEPVSVVADEEGRFRFPEADSGLYLLLASPSTDASGRPSYAVRPRGMLVEMGAGDRTQDVELQPLIPVAREDGGYEFVTRVEGC